MVADKVEIRTVGIPTSVAEAHDADSRFDQASSDQEVIVASRCSVVLVFVRFSIPVALDQFRILFAQIQGV